MRARPNKLAMAVIAFVLVAGVWTGIACVTNLPDTTRTELVHKEFEVLDVVREPGARTEVIAREVGRPEADPFRFPVPMLPVQAPAAPRGPVAPAPGREGRTEPAAAPRAGVTRPANLDACEAFAWDTYPDPEHWGARSQVVEQCNEARGQ